MKRSIDYNSMCKNNSVYICAFVIGASLGFNPYVLAQKSNQESQLKIADQKLKEAAAALDSANKNYNKASAALDTANKNYADAAAKVKDAQSLCDANASCKKSAERTTSTTLVKQNVTVQSCQTNTDAASVFFAKLDDAQLKLWKTYSEQISLLDKYTALNDTKVLRNENEALKQEVEQLKKKLADSGSAFRPVPKSNNFAFVQPAKYTKSNDDIEIDNVSDSNSKKHVQNSVDSPSNNLDVLKNLAKTSDGIRLDISSNCNSLQTYVNFILDNKCSKVYSYSNLLMPRINELSSSENKALVPNGTSPNLVEVCKVVYGDAPNLNDIIGKL